MNRFNDENRIISDFQNIEDEEVLFLPESVASENVYRSIHIKSLWDEWTDSSSKSAPPPDFYIINDKLMMDVMRVDDHAFEDINGRIQNPTNAMESRLYNELEKHGISEQFPNAEIIVNPKTELQTEQDHNYRFYKRNFERVVSEHIKKISLYQQNHAGYKTVFFVMDESSAYLQCKEIEPDLSKVRINEVIAAMPHLFFLDKSFVNVFWKSGIDFLIWYAPYKLLRTTTGLINLPKATIFDCSADQIEDLIDYISDKMYSNEL